MIFERQIEPVIADDIQGADLRDAEAEAPCLRIAVPSQPIQAECAEWVGTEEPRRLGAIAQQLAWPSRIIPPILE